jgi:pimeloyl-ACP methyl ester carboxylesterase
MGLERSEGVTTFVLVHGTGHGGWCWQEVARMLRAAGAEVYAPTLSGVGDRRHLADCGIDLTTHITDVADLLFCEDLEDVVLVGHSHGGMVVTGVAAVAPERLRLLVYLDAYIPEAGQSQFDLWPPAMRADVEADAAAHGGFRSPPSAELLGITAPGLAAWAEARITPHPVACYVQPVPAGNEATAALPRAYISCTEGPMAGVLGRFAAKARASGWPVREIATGHDAMLTEPRQVADRLLELAGGD